MEPTNETSVDEATQAPPGNPMYAGGIAVLVAFVLFMYWGSLNEKDDSKDAAEGKTKKSKTVTDGVREKTTRRQKGKKGRKKKGHRSGVYSVSDAMAKNLPPETADHDQSCACCEQCRLQEHEGQNERTSLSIYGTHLLSKSTQTCLNSSANKFYQERGRFGARPYSSVRSKEPTRDNVPRRKRALSLPNIVALPSYPACTCAHQFLIGRSQDRTSSPRASANVPPLSLVPNSAICDERGDLVTSESIRNPEGVELEFCNENTSAGFPVDSEMSNSSAVARHFLDDAASVPQSPGAEGLMQMSKSTQRNGDPAQRSNGKTLRQLDDAFVRLEQHPDVTITIVAESIM